jgi:DNA-binding NarL/FixJ family response regulator
MKLIKIALIDDHDLFREGIRLVLSQIDGFEVVFDTSDGHSFLDYLQNSTPDIVLMDINMPLIDGVETTKKALQLLPSLRIIALSMFSDTVHYTQMINAGVRGFILKKASKSELQKSIEEVSQGGSFFSQDILQKLAFQYIHSNQSNQLTVREIDVLDLICKGLTSKEMADKLFISIKTVEVHRTNIFLKTNVRNATELIIWAVRNNIITIE